MLKVNAHLFALLELQYAAFILHKMHVRKTYTNNYKKQLLVLMICLIKFKNKLGNQNIPRMKKITSIIFWPIVCE